MVLRTTTIRPLARAPRQIQEHMGQSIELSIRHSPILAGTQSTRISRILPRPFFKENMTLVLGLPIRVSYRNSCATGKRGRCLHGARGIECSTLHFMGLPYATIFNKNTAPVEPVPSLFVMQELGRA